MADKILYANKISIQNDETIPETAKVTDNNMNEIKTVVNSNADILDDKVDKNAAGKLQLLIDDLTEELASTNEMLEEAVSPIMTENNDYITTESGNKLVIGM